MIDTEIRSREDLLELVNESLKRIIKHIRKVLPKMDEEELRALLKG